MKHWREVFDAETVERIEGLTEEQKQLAAENYALATLQNQSGHLTVEQARASLDHWPIYYFGWLKSS